MRQLLIEITALLELKLIEDVVDEMLGGVTSIRVMFAVCNDG